MSFLSKTMMHRMSEDARQPCQFAQLTTIHSNDGQSGESWHTRARQIAIDQHCRGPRHHHRFHSWEDIEPEKLVDTARQLAYI